VTRGFRRTTRRINGCTSYTKLAVRLASISADLRISVQLRVSVVKNHGTDKVRTFCLKTIAAQARPVF
jgi:hypothetical protein